MWILIVFGVIIVAFWTYGMITNKEFRDANIESARKAQRKRKRKNSKAFDNIFAFVLIALFIFLLLSL